MRTPLNGILGYAQILQRSAETQQYRKGLNVIYESGTHLLNLINDILDLSKIEAQRMELYPQDFHFLSFLMGITEMSRIRAEQKGLSLEFVTAPNLPIGVTADDKRLRQVILSLLGNAIKFTDTGRVSFLVNLSPDHPGSDVSIPLLRFIIKDTGVGISAQDLDVLQPLGFDCVEASDGEGRIWG